MVRGVDADIQRAGSISGSVLYLGHPLWGRVGYRSTTEEGEVESGVQTGLDGAYSLTGLKTGELPDPPR